jgi:tetratricopeptide (TPR) repeat protein
MIIENKRSRLVPLLFIILCATFVVAGSFVINDLSIYTPDSARYLVWANSLASFDGYKDGTLPEPQRYVIHAPLYSALLAPVERVFPYSVIAAKYFMLLMGMIVLIAFYRWVAMKSGPPAALLGSILLVCNPLFLVYSTEILSEIPFAIALILFFILFERFNHSEPLRPLWVLGVTVALTSAILLREPGIALLFSAALFVFSKKNWKEVLFIIGVPVLVYGIWHIRNEWIIAPLENPANTNTKYFLGHYFTMANSSLVDEFSTRIMVNLRIYASFIPKMLFCTFYPPVEYKLINQHSTIVSAAASTVNIAKYLLGVVTLALAGHGAFLDNRGGKQLNIKLLFIVPYLVIILLYPVNDLRFLFPFLFCLLFYAGVSVHALMNEEKFVKVPNYLLFAGLAVCIIPNLLWEAEFAKESVRYNRLSVEDAGNIEAMENHPPHFRQPVKYIGQWIDGHTPPNAVIVSCRKEYVFWLGTRKLTMFNSSIPVNTFDAYLRDYKVPYLIDVEQENGMYLYDFQTSQSTHFSFPVACRYGAMVVLKVVPKSEAQGNKISLGAFAQGMALSNERQFEKASRQFDQVLSRDPDNVAATYYDGVGKEFEGKYSEATNLFERLKSSPQAGVFLLNAVNHQTIVGSLQLLNAPLSDTLKSRTAMNIALQYWGEGFRTEACHMIHEAVRFDSSNLAASLYGIFFSLQQGDTLIARELALAGVRLQPQNPTVTAWTRYFTLVDSSNVLPDSAAIARNSIAIARQMVALGITEASIDLLLQVLKKSPANIDVLLMLSDLYIARGRFLPAADALRSVIRLDSSNEIARARLDEIQHYLE